MFKIIRNADCYDPGYIGRKDILVVLDRIGMVEEDIPCGSLPGIEVFDCMGKIACPGFIDQHVHILGGGGEKGPGSRIPEISPEDILAAGISTVVGVLGLDCMGRSVGALLSKAGSLEKRGIGSYIYTGYYGVPAVTITGSVQTDIACIDKIVGLGEIAISDFRSAHPEPAELKRLAFETLTGGMLGGKAGVMHMHVGDGKRGLSPLLELIEDSDFPPGMFVPTHLNRNRALFEQAVAYAGTGGNVDLTAGEITGKGLSVADAMRRLLDAGTDMKRVTVSSDGNGSMPGYSGTGQGGTQDAAGDPSRVAQSTAPGTIGSLFTDIRDCVANKGIPTEIALGAVTSNVASVLKLYPERGSLKPLSRADILILDSGFKVDKLFTGGRLAVDNGIPLKRQ